MNTQDLTKLVTLILAISISGERLVTFLKTLIPWLSSPPPSPTGRVGTSEVIRQVVVMIIAFLACWLTAEIADVSTPIKPSLLGLLASGGSAFWTNILSYVKGVKDIKTQEGLQAKIQTANTIAGSQNLTIARQEELALQRIIVSPQPDFKN